MNEVLRDIESRMSKTVETFRNDLSRLRTGRASLALLDGLSVDYYGAQTPVNQVATLSVPDPATIVIAPWEPKVLADVERAILKSNLGLTPTNDGKVIRLGIPPLTEERRRELVKVARQDAEAARNALRQLRREGKDQIKALEKAKEISEDQMHDGNDSLQKLTDTYSGKIGTILEAKETEIMEV